MLYNICPFLNWTKKSTMRHALAEKNRHKHFNHVSVITSNCLREQIRLEIGLLVFTCFCHLIRSDRLF